MDDNPCWRAQRDGDSIRNAVRHMDELGSKVTEGYRITGCDDIQARFPEHTVFAQAAAGDGERQLRAVDWHI